MTITRTQLDTAIQTYADAFKSGNPSLLRFAALELGRIIETLPEQWEATMPASSMSPAEG